MANAWQSICARKQEERISRIPVTWRLTSSIQPEATSVLDVPRKCGILSREELDLTDNFDATALLSGLSTGLLKSVDVTTAFCKRAAVAQQVTNCLTEIFFEDAIARAKELDESFARTKQPVGPLHGLPISLKDSFKVKGYDASLGVAELCFKPASTNSTLVELLLSLGAVLYCKTNVPLTLMALDSHNNVFGRTLNPANLRLTAGGSSGGEGALIAMRGSVLGVGTDIGGSIRVPSFCNGLYGVKPSHGRVPYAGQEGGGPLGGNKLAIESTAGPIAVSLRDCETFLRVICDGNPAAVDPDVFSQTWAQQEPLPLHRSLFRRSPRLTVGLMRTDGHVTPLPPIERLMDQVAESLGRSGAHIDVVEIDVSALGPQILKTFNGILSIEGANAWFDLLEKTGEPLSPWMQGRLRRRPTKSTDEVRNLQAQRVELLTASLGIWRERGGYWRSQTNGGGERERTLDVIVCPPAPHPVPPIDRWNSANYTSMWNLLDYPAGIISIRPFGTQDLEGELSGSKPLNGWDKINQELWTKIDRRVYVGGSLGVQIVAPRLMERKLVDSMAVIDEALKPLRQNYGKSSRL